MEKDFWVCWMLRRLFEPPIVHDLLFKGGTSLAKAYHAIRRFSEDLDLTIPRAVLGFAGEGDIPAAPSRKQQQKRLDALVAAGGHWVRDVGRPCLAERAAAALGRAAGADDWFIDIDEQDEMTLVFRYPSALDERAYGVSAYIRPAVRLEFGVRGELEPSEQRPVQPYCTELFPRLTERPTCDVHVLASQRTFWEKATICHAEYYRPHASPRPPRISRHYADVAELAVGEAGREALRRPDLLAAVALHKNVFFSAAWARYEDATPVGLRLVPHPLLEAELRTDFRQMEVKYFGAPPRFDDVLARLRELEGRIRPLAG